MAERKSLLAKDALTTLEAVMEFLGLEPDDPEVLDITKNNLERLINSASSYLETMTGRKFARQDYVENHYGSGSQELCLNQYPIRAVEKILDVENQVNFGSLIVCLDVLKQHPEWINQMKAEVAEIAEGGEDE